MQGLRVTSLDSSHRHLQGTTGCSTRPRRLRAPCSPPSISSNVSNAWLASSSRICRLEHSRHIIRAGAGDMPGSSSSSGGRPPNNGNSGTPRRGKPSSKARKPGLFEIKVMTPPPRSLGIYALPPTTHNGEEIEIDGNGYVVTSLVLQYKVRLPISKTQQQAPQVQQ
eukprot:GHUV01016452.1.p1 GENE.GHUV01016452.1~~GHUV01016452.1.p1  ORF type:complete len:167 (+),score=59.64 GHUV01016452.1:421-921(+)